jgi:hypothetical protein
MNNFDCSRHYLRQAFEQRALLMVCRELV